MHTGELIGPWEVLRPLGEGGMGAVYLATRPMPDGVQQAAVKVLHRHFVANHEFRRRFAREVATAGKVRGPFVAPLLDADVEAAQPWLATAYVDGPNLRQQVDQRGALQGDGLRSFALGTAVGLAAVHEAGVIHRDLTPSNVLLGAGGPRIVDFGIATMPDASTITQTGGVIGTPAWMSPEQLTQDETTTASDIWAWGATTAFAALGRAPVAASRPEVVLYRVLEGKLDLDGLPDWLDDAVRLAMRAEPAERPTAEELLDLIGPIDGDQAEWATRNWRRFGPALATPPPPGLEGHIPAPTPPLTPPGPVPAAAPVPRWRTPAGLLGIFLAVAIASAAVTVLLRGGIGDSTSSSGPTPESSTTLGPETTGEPPSSPTPTALIEGTGLGVASFGDPASTAVPALIDEFGAPSDDIIQNGCIEPSRWISWADLTAEFAPGPSGEFIGYFFGTTDLDEAAPDITTVDGITINTAVRELREDVPGVELLYDEILDGYTFTTPDGVSGTATGTGDFDRVRFLRAGGTRCPD